MMLAFEIVDPVVIQDEGTFLVSGRALKSLVQRDILYVNVDPMRQEETRFIVMNIEGYGQSFTKISAAHSCTLTLQGMDAQPLFNTKYLYSND